MSWLVWLLVKVVLWLAVSVGTLILTGYCPTYRRYKYIQKLPGPKGLLILGNIVELAFVPVDDLLTWLQDKFKDHDRMMRLWLLPVSNVYLRDPEDVQVLCSSMEHISKGDVYDLFTPWLGRGLLTSSGDKWHSRRKLLTPAFHFKILEEHMTIINKSSKILCSKLDEERGEVDIGSFLTLCTLDIIVGTAMGIEVNAQIDKDSEYVTQLKRVTEMLTERMIRPHLFLEWMFKLTDIGKKFTRCVSYLHSISYKLIRQRKKEFNSNSEPISNNKVRHPFLDTMLEQETKHPGSFTDQDLREEVDTFMFEGHDTTSVALVYILYNLVCHQQIQERVYQEQLDIFGASKDVIVEDLNRMTYLDKVIKESLRLYPSVPVVVRQLHKDLILDDNTLIPAGANVAAVIYLIHRNEKYWDEPDKFDPERFSEEKCRERHPYAYLPFSAGPRNCIGQKFAIMELKTVVSHIVRRFKVQLTSTPEITHKLHLVLRPNPPVKCIFIPR